jgi:glycosyltransferase involved in cell wall biosynthesis
VAEVEEADFVLLPSSFVARSFLAKGVPADRLLKNPFPVQMIAGSTGLQQRQRPDDPVFRILYVGSVSVRKGLRYLIEAFRQFKHPRKELWIVGPTNNPTGLEGLTMPDGVKFFGPLKGDELQEVYKRATVFCLPSLEEGLALVLTEAIYYGLPIVATENTGIDDLLPNDEGGMTTPIRDPGAICDCLDRLAGDPCFLERKQSEVTEASARLARESRVRPGLAVALKGAFASHHSKTTA